MRIGLDYRMAGIHHGGIGRYVFELADHLLKLDRQNLYYLFYNRGSLGEIDGLKSRQQNVRLVEVNSRHYSFSEQTKFLLQLNKYKLDLVHFPNFNVPILYSRPFVVTIHDLIHHKLGGVKKTNLAHFFAYKTVIKHAILKAKKIITVSNASKQEILTEFPESDKKIQVIYEAVATKTLPTPKQVADFKNIFYLSRPYFLFVGVLQRNKNLVLLCSAFDLFLKRFKLDVDLVMVGKIDSHYPEIKNECLEIENQNRLVFTGELSQSDLNAAYAGAVAYVSASKLEGFGLPGLEAMSFGLPLAVSNIPVFNEIYENGAIYFDPDSPENIAQCLNILAQDQLYFMQLKQKALARAKVFSWEKCAQETLQLYSSAIS